MRNFLINYTTEPNLKKQRPVSSGVLLLPFMTHLFFSPCSSDALSTVSYFSSSTHHTPKLFFLPSPCLVSLLPLPCLPRRSSPSTLHNNSQAVTHHEGSYFKLIASRVCILFSSHTTETADYNYFDTPPLLCVAANSSYMKLLSCSQWMVGEWTVFKWYIYSELMNDSS